MLEFPWECKLQAQGSSNHSFPTHCLCNWYCSGSGRNYMAIRYRITLALLHTSLFHADLCIFEMLMSRSFSFSLLCASTVCNIHMLGESPVSMSLYFSKMTLLVFSGKE